MIALEREVTQSAVKITSWLWPFPFIQESASSVLFTSSGSVPVQIPTGWIKLLFQECLQVRLRDWIPTTQHPFHFLSCLQAEWGHIHIECRRCTQQATYANSKGFTIVLDCVLPQTSQELSMISSMQGRLSIYHIWDIFPRTSVKPLSFAILSHVSRVTREVQHHALLRNGLSLCAPGSKGSSA